VSDVVPLLVEASKWSWEGQKYLYSKAAFLRRCEPDQVPQVLLSPGSCMIRGALSDAGD